MYFLCCSYFGWGVGPGQRTAKLVSFVISLSIWPLHWAITWNSHPWIDTKNCSKVFICVINSIYIFQFNRNSSPFLTLFATSQTACYLIGFTGIPLRNSLQNNQSIARFFKWKAKAGKVFFSVYCHLFARVRWPCVCFAPAGEQALLT